MAEAVAADALVTEGAMPALVETQALMRTAIVERDGSGIVPLLVAGGDRPTSRHPSAALRGEPGGA